MSKELADYLRTLATQAEKGSLPPSMESALSELRDNKENTSDIANNRAEEVRILHYLITGYIIHNILLPAADPNDSN